MEPVEKSERSWKIDDIAKISGLTTKPEFNKCSAQIYKVMEDGWVNVWLVSDAKTGLPCKRQQFLIQTQYLVPI